MLLLTNNISTGCYIAQSSIRYLTAVQSCRWLDPIFSIQTHYTWVSVPIKAVTLCLDWNFWSIWEEPLSHTVGLWIATGGSISDTEQGIFSFSNICYENVAAIGYINPIQSEIHTLEKYSNENERQPSWAALVYLDLLCPLVTCFPPRNTNIRRSTNIV